MRAPYLCRKYLMSRFLGHQTNSNTFRRCPEVTTLELLINFQSTLAPNMMKPSENLLTYFGA